jgi:hemoglobin-like flavoprotein
MHWSETMSPDQVRLVQDSFAKVRPIAHQAADLFYGRLFEVAPDVRALFPDDMADQKRKLMAMLATAVINLHQMEKAVTAVQELGRRHAGYGVNDRHYKVVGEVLIWTLGQVLAQISPQRSRTRGSPSTRRWRPP